MSTRTDEYADHRRSAFLQQSRAAVESGDPVQATEKLWSATAQMVKSVAERRGCPHGGHGELFQVVNRLAREQDDPSLRDLFQVANSLHSNLFKNWSLSNNLHDLTD